MLPLGRIVIDGLVVGAVTGLVGAGGGFLVVPALALLGAADMISVYIRETLIQLWTPDRVRGRVNAVNMVFVGASNELGEFRAGSMAALVGTVPAVVRKGNRWGCQFHPERSARTGAQILRNFIELPETAAC